MASTGAQVALLLWKNLTLRKRKPVLLVTELVLPLVLLAVLCYVRHQQPPVRKPEFSYKARALPSAGLVPVLESLFCSGGQPDGFGFHRYPNSSTTAILRFVESLADQWPPPTRAPPDGADVCDDSLGPKQNRTRVASAVILWMAVQSLVCGHTPDPPPSMNSTADFVEYLGLNAYYKGRLALMLHVLSHNPRVLFSPNSTQAQRIISKTNETFAYLDSLSDVARTFLHMSGPPPVALPIPQQQATLLACAWLELMASADLDLFRPFPTEEDAVQYFLEEAAAENVSVVAVLAMDLPPDGRLPNHLTYKIRQNASLTANTVVVRDRSWLPGPRAYDYNYYEFGFTWLQDMVERAVASLHAGRTVLEPAGAVHQMPYPCFVEDQFLFYLQTVMPLCLTLGWVCGVALQVQLLVLERQDRIAEVMQTLGVSGVALRASWLVTSLLLTTPSALAATLVLRYGEILPYSATSLVFCLLQLFVIDNIALAHLLSALSMGRAKTAAACSVIIYFLFYIPYVYVSVVENTAMVPVSTPIKTLTCLMSPSAFSLAFKYIGFYEQQGTGVDWSSWTVSPVENDSFNLALVMLLMLLDPLLYGLLVWYIEQVFPGGGGVAQPWYFLFSPRYWRCSREQAYPAEQYTAQPDSGLPCEPDPSDLPLAVELCNVSKRFAGESRSAVDNLCLRLYEGQVTALLGHNGAGKTTTLSILSGLLSPTSGAVRVYGRDVRRELAAVRRSLGFCPQQDVLMDGLTAVEHVWFYSRIRGATDSQAQEQGISVLADVDLLKKRNCDVRLLSGGQRRKLSVAIAFLGGSRCIVLDEPTAGVDPHSRRAIWRLIMQYKRDRTILFCTHHMEEADVLGNRIAIMSAGRVQCVGSPPFLRRHLGAGYYLHVVRQPPPSDGEAAAAGGDSARSSAVTSLLRHHVASAQLVRWSPHELHYLLPGSELAAGVVPALLEQLQAASAQLGVTGFGVQTTSMEEVFLRVSRHGHDEGPISAVPSKDDIRDNLPPADSLPETAKSDAIAGGSTNPGYGAVPSDVTSGLTCERLSGKPLLWQQSVAVVYKRFCCARRNWILFISSVLLPAFFTVLAMSVAVVAPNVSDKPALVMAPTQYFNYTWPEPNVVPVANNQQDLLNIGYSSDADSWTVADTLHLPSGLGATCVLSDPRNVSAGFDPLCRTVGVGGGTVRPGLKPPKQRRSSRGVSQPLTTLPPDPQLYPVCRCRLDGSGQECSAGYRLPLQTLLVTRDLLQNITRQAEPSYYRATTDIYRLRRYGGLSLGLVHDVTPPDFGRRLSPLARRTSIRRLAKAWFNNKGFHAVPAYVNALNNAVLRANLPPAAGNPAGYGITCVNHPLPHTETFLLEELIRRGTDVLIAVFLLVALSFVPASLVLLLVAERRSGSRHLQRLCGVPPAIYWAANYACDVVATGLPSAACILIVVAFQDPAYTSASNLPAVALLILFYGWSMTPLMYPASFVFREPASAYMAVVLVNLFLGAAALLTTSMFESFSQTATVDVLKSIFLVLPSYCLGRGVLEIAYNHYHNEFLTKTGKGTWLVPPLSGVAQRYLLAMVAMGTVGLIVTLLLEYRPLRRRQKRGSRPPSDATLNLAEDRDVADERLRVTSGAANGHALKLDRLTKVYRSGTTAVDQLCFSVAPGECFGLLGVNGAGKTSTFRMLTADTTVTSGDAVVRLKCAGAPLDVSIADRADLALSEMGYCPQHDALHLEMTVREHLAVYAMIRGVPAAQQRPEVGRLLRQLQLQPAADRPVSCLSIGTRRRLSTALALVASPSLVLLDEPSTGLDPGGRRALWELVRHQVAAGRAVLLTSHSMDECEALCTRLAVMVNGRLRCLGSPQHLKDRFGDGYTITIRSGESQQSAVDERVKAHLPTSRLKECHLNVWTYELAAGPGPGALPLADLFRRLEQLTTELRIEDCYVSQNTLDSVFISLARDQNESQSPAREEAPLLSEPELCPPPQQTGPSRTQESPQPVSVRL